jgi:hypothetical protein
VILEDHRRHRHAVLGKDAAVGPHLEGELVEVDALPHAGVLHLEVHLLDRRVMGIERDHPDRTLFLLLIGGDVPAAGGDLHLHVDLPLLVEGGDVEIGVQDLDPGIGLQIAGLQFARARHLETGVELVVGVHLEADLLQVEDDLAHVLEHAGDRAEFMENPFDLDRGHRGPLQARKERSTERVPHRQAENLFPTARSWACRSGPSGSLVSSMVSASGRFFHFIAVMPPRIIDPIASSNMPARPV